MGSAHALEYAVAHAQKKFKLAFLSNLDVDGSFEGFAFRSLLHP